MIISRPSSNTLVSFTLFLILSFIVLGMSLIQVLSDENPPWYTFLVLIVIGPISIFVVFKIFINYKVIEVGNNQIKIVYKVRRKERIYSIRNVIRWKESVVKTGKNSTFKELEVLFDDNFKIRLGLREYTHYSDIHAYLTRKLANKKVNEA